jgi:threonine/homoserine/homoserine lactone efflux protein
MPCLPLLGVFSYLILVSRAWYESLSFILSFSLGTFISPLILLAGLAGFIRPLLAKRQAYERIFSLICGLILVYLGLRLSARIF